MVRSLVRGHLHWIMWRPQPNSACTRGTSDSRRQWLAGILLLGLALMACASSPAGLQPTGGSSTSTPGFADPLTTATSDWAVQPPYCQFVEGGYQVTANACFSTYLVDDGGAVVDVKVAQAKQNALVGLAIRRVSAGNFYVFGLVLDGTTFDGDWVFARVVGGKGSLIVSGSAATIRQGTGEANTLRVDFQGRRFVFSINGTQVGQTEDATFTGLGLLGLNAGGDSSAIFTDFQYLP